MKKSTIFLSIFLLLIIICLVSFPETTIKASLIGINVWATNILPALFPFFLFTKLLGELGFINKLSSFIAPITQKLYNTSGISGYVYLMSILSGYPVGAKITCDLYENKAIDLGQAHRIVSFTSTSGPLFVLGTVAIGMFCNKTMGYVVLFAHFLGAILNGLLYRKFMLTENKNENNTSKNTPINPNILENCMLASIKSILIVGGYICAFFIIISIVNNFNIFYPINLVLTKIFPALNPQIVTSILNGIIELTKGCLDVSTLNLSPLISTIIISGLTSFGGISINLQALTFLKRMGINLKFYFTQKITHTLISVALAFAIGIIVF